MKTAFWDIALIPLMTEAVHTSETSVYFTKTIGFCENYNIIEFPKDRKFIGHLTNNMPEKIYLWSRLVIFSLLSKNESRLIKSPVCLCVPPLITSDLLGRFS
jgi:hypothetical protein